MKVCLINHTKTILKPVNELSKEMNLEVIAADDSGPEITVKTENPQIVLLNWSDKEALSICSSIRSMKSPKGYIHILLIGIKETSSQLDEAIESGADDFILMPFSKEELKTRLLIAEKHIETRNGLTRAKKKLIKHAKEDPITSVLNRRSLFDEILNEMGRAARKGDFSTAMMINLKNMQDLLKDLGPKVVDSFLGEFSRRLKKSIRPYDKIGRYDNSRFLIFLPATNSENSHIVADRIVQKLGSSRFTYKDKLISPCVSIGISELDPDDIGKNIGNEDILINDLIMESFIRRSEFASDSACEEGDNQIKIYTF